ncbi:MAG: hypothetical protein ACK4YV_01305 [Emticicia sp.]
MRFILQMTDWLIKENLCFIEKLCPLKNVLYQGSIYEKKLTDISLDVLNELIDISMKSIKNLYPS